MGNITSIGVIVNQSNEFSYNITLSIFKAAERFPDVRIICFFYELNVYNFRESNFSELSENINNFVRNNDLDGLIVLSGTIFQSSFKNTITSTFFEKIKVPIVSIGKKIGNYNAVLIDNKKSVEKAISKLVNFDRDRKFIMIKGPSNSDEALERHEGFFNSMKSENIEEKNIQVFDGDFTAVSVEDVFPEIEKEIKNGTKVSVFACNDEMAIRFYEKCKESQISITEDVYVLGFDGLDKTLEYSISTIKQPFDLIGKNSLDNVLKMIKMENVLDMTLSLEITERKSTGNNNCEEKLIYNKNFTRNYLSIERILFNSLDDYIEGKNFDMSFFWEKFAKGLSLIGVKECYLFLNKEKSVLDSSDIGKNYSTMVIGYNPDKNYINGDKNLLLFNENFFLHNDGILLRKKRNFIVYPLFSNKYNYGTIIFGVDNEFMYCFYELIVIRLISFFKTFFSIIQKNEEIVLKEKEASNNLMDSMTGLCSRRWYDANIQKTIMDIKRNNKVVYLFLFDVDKFKSINDDYGHDEGDYALTLVASILTSIFRVNEDKEDIVIRYGGDEFLVIVRLPFKKDDYIENINKRVISEQNIQNGKLAIRCFNEKIKPYKISLSMGVSCFSDPRSLNREKFNKTLKEADDKMYIEKHIKKERELL